MAEPDTQTSDKEFYLDDLHVGQRFISRTHVVDEAQIKAFAHQFDPQPFHLDDEAAKHTLFGGLAASGWHTAAITMRLLVETFLVESWLEHLRQHERVTNADRVLQEAVHRFQTEGAPKITHLIAAEPGLVVAEAKST